MKTPIPIIDGKGYLFDLEVVKRLREEYHICGLLVGLLPQFPQQNVFMGLPLQLMSEEVQYLIKKNVVQLVNNTDYHLYYFASSEMKNSSQTVAMTTTFDDGQTNFVMCRNAVAYEEPQQNAYAMFEFLLNQGLYCMPGLRFGCQFLAYPGDPLRYHAHYSCRGLEWDEKFDILDIVGNGRLATAVKKCWVVGAQPEEDDNYRAFSIEWAGFG